MPESGYPFAAKVGQIKPPKWASSDYRNQYCLNLNCTLEESGRGKALRSAGQGFLVVETEDSGQA